MIKPSSTNSSIADRIVERDILRLVARSLVDGRASPGLNLPSSIALRNAFDKRLFSGRRGRYSRLSKKFKLILYGMRRRTSHYKGSADLSFPVFGRSNSPYLKPRHFG